MPSHRDPRRAIDAAIELIAHKCIGWSNRNRRYECDECDAGDECSSEIEHADDCSVGAVFIDLRDARVNVTRLQEVVLDVVKARKELRGNAG